VDLEDKNISVKVNYCFDGCLMYLIQEITKKPSAEIIAFFYELAGQIAEIGAKDKLKGAAPSSSGRRRWRSNGMRKNVVDYFPNTLVPFQMLVKGYRTQRGTWNPATRQNDDVREVFECTAEISLAQVKQYIPEDELKAVSEALMERALLDAPMDGVKIPEFRRPTIKSNKMFEDLMNSFAGRPPKEKKRRKKKSDEAIPTR
jgi:hypothetical protein